MNARDWPIPPQALIDRVGGTGGEDFLAFGEKGSSELAKHVPKSPAHILDFGCGIGRYTRWFRQRYPHALISACDIDEASICWNLRNLGQTCADFKMSRADPPLWLADGEVDLAFAVSVFTHMPWERFNAWVREFARIIKPGGTAAISVLGEMFWSLHQGMDPEQVPEFVANEGQLYLAAPVPPLTQYADVCYVRRETAQRAFEEEGFFKVKSVVLSKDFGQDLFILGRT